jgi:hypothetical protein
MMTVKCPHYVRTKTVNERISMYFNVIERTHNPQNTGKSTKSRYSPKAEVSSSNLDGCTILFHNINKLYAIW